VSSKGFFTLTLLSRLLRLINNMQLQSVAKFTTR